MNIILWEIGILAFLLWLVSIGFVLFSGMLFYRQQLIFRHILKRLSMLEKKLTPKVTPPEKPTKTYLSIPKDEPIMKYEKMTLPEDVQISFVEKE